MLALKKLQKIACRKSFSDELKKITSSNCTKLKLNFPSKSAFPPYLDLLFSSKPSLLEKDIQLFIFDDQHNTLSKSY